MKKKAKEKKKKEQAQGREASLDFLLLLLLALAAGTWTADLRYDRVGTPFFTALYALAMAAQRWIMDGRAFDPENLTPDEAKRLQTLRSLYYCGGHEEDEKENAEKAVILHILDPRRALLRRIAFIAIFAVAIYGGIRFSIGFHFLDLLYMGGAGIIAYSVTSGHKLIALALNALAAAYCLTTLQQRGVLPAFLYGATLIVVLLSHRHTELAFRAGASASTWLTARRRKLALTTASILALLAGIGWCVNAVIPENSKEGGALADSSVVQEKVIRAGMKISRGLGKWLASDETATQSAGPESSSGMGGKASGDVSVGASSGGGFSSPSHANLAQTAARLGDRLTEVSPGQSPQISLDEAKELAQVLEEAKRTPVLTRDGDDMNAPLSAQPDTSPEATSREIQALKDNLDLQIQQIQELQDPTNPDSSDDHPAVNSTGSEKPPANRQVQLSEEDRAAAIELLKKMRAHSGATHERGSQPGGSEGAPEISAQNGQGSAGDRATVQGSHDLRAQEGTTLTPSGKNSSSSSSAGANKAKEPKPLFSEQALKRLMKFLETLIVIGAIIAVVIFVWKLLERRTPEELEEQAPRITSEEVQIFRHRMRELDRAKLSAEEEIIRRYNLFLQLMEKVDRARPESLPPTEYGQTLETRFPFLKQPLRLVTSTFCDVYYGQSSTAGKLLSEYRKNHLVICRRFLKS